MHSAWTGFACHTQFHPRKWAFLVCVVTSLLVLCTLHFISLLGYDPYRRPATSHKLLAREKCLNAIAFMRISGILDCQLESEAVGGDAFYMHVQKHLLPHLVPFDGTKKSEHCHDGQSIYTPCWWHSWNDSKCGGCFYTPTPIFTWLQPNWRLLVKQYETDLETNLDNYCSCSF